MRGENFLVKYDGEEKNVGFYKSVKVEAVHKAQQKPQIRTANYAIFWHFYQGKYSKLA